MIDTHYIYRPPALDADAFASFVADSRKLLAAAPAGIVVRSETGEGNPSISDLRIAFNGDRERAAQEIRGLPSNP